MKRVPMHRDEFHRMPFGFNNNNEMNIKKITTVFLSLLVFLFIFQNQSMAQEKRITIQKKNISLKDAINEIERQTSYSIAYKKSETNEKQRINLSLKDVSLEKH